MKMVYDEWYGEISYAQRAAYRKYNVSPSDHDTLCDYLGANNHAAITAAVKENSESGMYSEYRFVQAQAQKHWDDLAIR